MTTIERMINTKAIIETKLDIPFSTKEYEKATANEGCCSITFLKHHRLVKIEKEPIKIEVKNDPKWDKYELVSVGVNGERVVETFWDFEHAKREFDWRKEKVFENNYYIRECSATKTIDAVRYWYTFDEVRFNEMMQKEIRNFKWSLDKAREKTLKAHKRLAEMEYAARILGIDC